MPHSFNTPRNSSRDNDSGDRPRLFNWGGLFKKKDKLTTPTPLGTGEPVEVAPSKKKWLIPAYLQSVDAFERSVSYAQRKAAVQGREAAYNISGTYTGQQHQNEALIRFLQDNPSKRAEWEAVHGLTHDNLQWLSQEYESTKGRPFGRLFARGDRSVRETSRDNTFFKKKTNSAGEINAQGGKAIEASEKERVFMDINNEMVSAWRKDIGGKLITGGLLGLLTSRTSNLNKALRNIESKYPGYSARIIQQLQIHFAQLNELTQAYGASRGKRVAADLFASALSPFGFERQSTLQRIQSDPEFTGRAGAFLQLAIGFAISAAMGAPSIYLGSINTGIKMADVRNPNKDVLSRALFNESYNSILASNDREHGRYNRMLGDNGVRAETRDALNQYRQSVDGTTGEYEEAVSEGYKATGGHILFRMLRSAFSTTEREMITNPRVSTAQKFEIIDAAIARYGEKPQTDNVRAQIANLQRLKTMYGRREQLQDHEQRASLPVKYHEALRIMNRFGEYDDIKSFMMPESTKQWMKVYLEWNRQYPARSKELLMYLWDSPDTPGFQKFIKAYSSGNIDAYNKSVVAEMGHTGRTGRGVEYGRDISGISSARELSTYLDSVEPGQGRLASIYAAQIARLGRNIQVDPNDIVRAAKRAQRGVSGNLFNSGRNSNNINTLKTYNGDGWMMNVPATYTGDGYVQHVSLTIGVKPNCSNLLIGGVGNRWYDATNLSSDLNFRIPLTVQIPNGGGGGGAPRSGGDSVINGNGVSRVPSPGQAPGVSGNFGLGNPGVQQATGMAPGVVILPTNPAGI